MRSRTAAIVRMLGMSEWGVVQIVLAQALTYVIPGWIFGLAMAQLFLTFIFNIMSKYTLVPIFAWLSVSALLFSILQGLVVPLLASIEPIWIALQKSIVRALDPNRPRMNVVEYSIQRSDVFFSEETTAIVVAGSTVSLLGFLLYYFVPWSLVVGQQSFLVLVFVLVLLGMFCGLSILAQTVQPFFEPINFRILCFWESKVVRDLAFGNLRAHRKRNRVSAMMFTLAMGLVVFIMIVLDIQYSSFITSMKVQWGSSMKVQNHYGHYLSLPVTDLEQVALKHPEMVEKFAWVSHDYSSAFWDITNGTFLSTLGRMTSQQIRLYPIYPDFYESQFGGLLEIWRPDGEDAASIIDRLYSSSGSRSLIISTAYAESLHLHVGDSVLLGGINASEYLRMDVAAFFSFSPTYRFAKRGTPAETDVLVSLPLFTKFGAGKLDHSSEFESPPMFLEGLAKEFHMRMRPNLNPTELRCFKRELIRGKEYYLEILDTDQKLKPLQMIQTAFGFFFDFAIVAASLVCLSSLIAASMIKIHDQAKDIGVMLSLGMRASLIRRAFFEESVVVIFTAGLLGIVIGSCVGWLVSAQQQIFSGGPISWNIPIRPVVVLLIISILLGIGSTWAPLRSLLSRSPISILRAAD